MDREDVNTVLMPHEVLLRLVTRSKRAHPRLRPRDERIHADDFVTEEAPSVDAIGPSNGPPPVMARGRAERCAVIALAAAFALAFAAIIAVPF